MFFFVSGGGGGGLVEVDFCYKESKFKKKYIIFLGGGRGWGRWGEAVGGGECEVGGSEFFTMNPNFK